MCFEVGYGQECNLMQLSLFVESRCRKKVEINLVFQSGFMLGIAVYKLQLLGLDSC